MKRFLEFGLAIFFVFVFLNSTAYAANFEFQVSPSLTSACLCSSVTPQNVQVSVKNLYQYPDTFSFVVDASPGFTPQIQQNLVLNPGETKSLDLFLINIGCSVIPGTYHATIKAKSGSTGESQTKDLELDVLNCYEAQLNIENKFQEMCMEENRTAIFYMNIENRGKYADTYGLTASVPWAAFSDNAVTIDAAGTKTVALALAPPENVKGSQFVNVQVKSQKFYSSDMDTIQLNILDCYSMTADLQPTETSVCLGEIVTQKLTISNTGIRNDSYSVVVPNWVTADKSSVSIEKKTADVNLMLKPTQKGKTYFNVTVVSGKDPSLSKTIPASVDVQECRGVAIIISPSQSSMCQGMETDFTVSVKNLGTIQDTFTLTTTSGVLDSNKVALNPKDTKELTLKISNITLPGAYRVRVKAQAGEVSDEASADVVVDNCYSASMDISPQDQSVCFGSSINYTVAVKNAGKLADNYVLMLENQFMNATRRFTLGSEQVRMEYFAVQVPPETEAKYYIVTAELSSDHVSSAVQTILTVKPKSSCYSVQLLSEDEKLVQICNATALPVTVKNTGEKRDRYTISIDGPGWAYISPDSVELSGGQQQEVYLYFSPWFGVDKKVYEITAKASSPSAQATKTIAVGVVENITGPSGNVTVPPPQNVTNITGGNVTGGLILGLDYNSWKVVSIVVITIIIIIILAIRFILLAKK